MILDMTKTTKLITKSEVRAAIRKLIVGRSGTVNPVREDDPYTCAYHRGRGRNVQRCIAGQIGKDFGLPTPPADADAVISLTALGTSSYGAVGHGLWGGRFTDDARKLLAAAQIVADFMDFTDDDETIQVRWGDIKLADLDRKAKDVPLS